MIVIKGDERALCWRSR